MLKPIAFAVSLISVVGCAAVSPEQGNLRPVNVEDGASAIRLARLAWIKAQPELRDRIGAEAEWQAHKTATLGDGIWTVCEKSEFGGCGNGVAFRMSRKDGHVLDIYILQ